MINKATVTQKHLAYLLLKTEMMGFNVLWADELGLIISKEITEEREGEFDIRSASDCQILRWEGLIYREKIEVPELNDYYKSICIWAKSLNVSYDFLSTIPDASYFQYNGKIITFSASVKIDRDANLHFNESYDNNFFYHWLSDVLRNESELDANFRIVPCLASGGQLWELNKSI